MGDPHQQHPFGHSPSYSTTPTGINEPIYHMNPALTINPVNEVGSSPIDPSTSMSQPPMFYDQARIYPEMSGCTTTSNPIPQSYSLQQQPQQASFSHTPLPNPQQQAHMSLQQPTTNKMYQESQTVTSSITNMLSFQPIPQQVSNMFQTHDTTKTLQNTPQPTAVSQHSPNLHPNFQATTPPPLSHLQGVSMYQQQFVPPAPMGSEAPQTFKTPTTNKVTKTRSPKKKVSPQAPAASSKSTETVVIPQFVIDPSLTQSPEVPMQSSPAVSGPPTALQGMTSFPKLKDLVGRLLVCTLDAYTDKDFGEKTLMNLARKLSTASISMTEDFPVLQVWENAIKQKDVKSGCVCIQRPREGRITVTKSGTGNSGSKKVFPQIVLCQMFRFPNIVFHHDIKSSEHCQNSAAVKPNTINPGGGESGEMGSELDGAADVICLNPYHYLVSPEAEARFLKQDKKAARDALKEGGGLQQQSTINSQAPPTQHDSNLSTQHPNVPQSIINKKKPMVKKPTPSTLRTTEDPHIVTNSLKFKANVPMPPEVVDLSSDDDESDDEIHHFMDDGVDYVKMWEEKAVFPNGTSGAIEELDEKKIFEEINFLSWSNEDNKFVDTDKALLEELKVYEEFESLIISGSYMDVIKEIKERRGEVENEKRQNLTGMSENNQKRLHEEEEVNKNANTQIQHHNRAKENRKDIDEPDIILHPITSHEDEALYTKDTNNSLVDEHQFLQHPINITTTASDKTLSSAFVDEDGESCDDTSGNNLSINLLSSSTPGSTNIGSQNVIASGSGTQQQQQQQPPATSDEDNVIQDLLEDIRGSFERQFDDEFNFDDEGATKDNVAVVSGVIGSTSHHHNVNIQSRGVSPTSFGVNIESDFNINPEEAAEVAAAVADMDIPDSEFLNAGSITQEEFDSFSNFLGSAGRSLQASTSNTPLHYNNPLQQPQDHSSEVNPQNTFPFHNPSNSQSSQFSLFQHPSTDSSQDFQF